jgi:cell division septation protein DedD
MRGIFWALVVVNVLAAGWFWWDSQQASKAAAAPTVAPVVAASVKVTGAGDKSLVLLEELKAAKLEEMVRAKERLRLEAVDQVEGAAEGAEQQLCTLVGAFPALLEAEYFVEHLRALDIAGAVQQVEVPGESAFWVYLPAEVSKKKALRLLHELQGKKIDSYVIPKGDLANGISLGLFSSVDAAEGRQQEIVEQGYPALVEEMERTYEEIWVVLAPAEAEKIDDDLWRKLLDKESALELRQNFCPGVASE